MDFLRALSLLVVVVWHWVFSVIIWHSDGPHASNPIATTRGFWVLTWLLQVMPVFFFVGGYAHLRTWQSLHRDGGGYGAFVRRRLGRLMGPTALCLAIFLVVRVVLAFALPDVGWITRGLILLLSPLWFLGVYVLLVLLAPLTIRAHERLGELVPVALVGGVVWVDLLRFHFDVPTAAWLNMVFVWALIHQLGYWYEQLAKAPRTTAAALALGGLIGLSAFTNMGLYPRSMVGVPGESFSNMGPPTLPIVALALFQIGIVLMLRPSVSALLERPRPRRLSDRANELSMTVFLWHLTGYAVAYGTLRLAGLHSPEDTTPAWWAQRPVWALAPALATIPLVALMRRFDRRKPAPT